jgi:hypothetical protein
MGTSGDPYKWNPHKRGVYELKRINRAQFWWKVRECAKWGSFIAAVIAALAVLASRIG